MSVAGELTPRVTALRQPAWWLLSGAVLLYALGLPLSPADELRSADDAFGAVQFALVVMATGVLLVRRPGHRFGVLLALTALVNAVASLTHSYAVHPLPGGPVVFWFGTVVGASTLGLLLVFLPLLFPDGRLPGPRWRASAYVGGTGTALLCAALAVKPGAFEGAPGVVNPLGTTGEVFLAVNVTGMALTLAASLAALASLAVRYRRGGEHTRVQVRWLGGVLALLVVGVVALNVLTRGDHTSNVVLDAVTGTVLVSGLPVLTAVALLVDDAPRLDRLLRRTLVYGTLWLLVTSLVLGVPFALGLAASARLPFAAAVVVAVTATLLVQPVRRRLLALADRIAAGASGGLAAAERRTARVTASRARLVAAAQAERRRIQRDLHDGAQQDLLALIARISLLRERGHADRRALTELGDEAGRALAGLRELAQGIHPPLLADHGVVAAVEERLARFPLPARLDVEDHSGARHADDVEAAAYFAVTEALTNVLKHAGASRVRVRLSDTVGALRVEVHDDGTGLPPGTGLSGLADRVEAVGGELTVRGDSGGTSVTATLPIRGAP